MKKLVSLLAIIAVLMLNTLPAAGQGVFISSENGDKISIFDDVDVKDPVNGNVVTVLGDISVDSRVSGQVIAVFGDVTVDSQISGQVVTLFGNTILNKNAIVNGDVITIGSLSKTGGARVLGHEVRILGESMNLDIGALLYFRLATMILFTLAVLIVGLLILTIARDQYTSMSRSIERNTGRKLILGILSLLAATILFLLLLVTLIAPVMYIVVLLLSTITASMYLGRLILKKFSTSNSIYMEFITGLISITLVKLLIIFLVAQQDPLLGFGLTGAFGFLVFSMGLGIHIEERYISSKK